MDNRFKKLRDEYNERLKDKNPKAKLYSVEDMCQEMKAAGFKVSLSKIKKIESNQYGVSIDTETLRAYKWKFNVSADWLIDNTVHTRKIDGDTASASRVIGLSDITIEKIAKLKPEYKMILDKMISHYGLLYVLQEIRNLLGYNYLKPRLELKFEEKKYRSGAEIDQYLYNAINDKHVSAFFNSVVKDRINQIVDSIMDDAELKEYFGKLDEKSKISSTITMEDIKRMLEDDKPT